MKKFISFLQKFYSENKRDSLSWRKTKSPYHILVSEVMLQQTQVSRVLIKYKEWIKRFPTAKKLAGSSLRDVLTLWQGLGYNRRAKFLYEASKILAKAKPSDLSNYDFYTSLPGVGQSTAGAVLAFTKNTPIVFIETNIRAVILHHFFKDREKVDDEEIREVLQKLLNTLPSDFSVRDFYYALYDYGSHLKMTLGKKKKDLHTRSKHYTTQSKFEGSRRQLRAFILKVSLGMKKMKDMPEVLKKYSLKDMRKIEAELKEEGLLTQSTHST
jgi:A/G-specific adenine glycosylase